MNKFLINLFGGIFFIVVTLNFAAVCTFLHTSFGFGYGLLNIFLIIGSFFIWTHYEEKEEKINNSEPERY